MQQLPLTIPAAARIFTVSELGRRIGAALESGIGLVGVVGEISNFKAAPSGHCYFTLKDDGACVSAVLFRSACARLKFTPRDGIEVLARGRVRFYEARGSLQLYVDTIEPRGLGALRLELERLREKLAGEGLLDPARKRPLPALPRTVGIVTALSGAALQDILKIARGRFPNQRVIVRPVRVQGMGAEIEIAAAICELASFDGVEVLIVGRGGGSVEDLWAFNDEGVARAIAASRVPVVSAVGHEVDVTIADLVADVRAPTPTAAAELVTPRKDEIVLLLEARRRALLAAVRRRVDVRRRELAALRARLRDPRRRIVELRAAVASHERRLATALRNRRRLLGERLAGLAAALDSLSPLAVLDRGYAVVWKDGARAVRSASEVAAGDALRIRVARGRIAARVESTEPEGEP